MANPEAVDRLLIHCQELVPLTDGPPTGFRRGAAMGQVTVVPDGAVAIHDGHIVAVGTTAEITSRYRAEETTDLSGFVVVPGFVDAHTHPVFAGTREHEFHQRCGGAEYKAIAAAGGGILHSMHTLRQTGEADLTEIVGGHLDGFVRHGTTTIEAKSGYGLSTADEVKSLRALAAAASNHVLTVRRTFLGAHEFPPEYRQDREAYVRLLTDEMIPAVRGLAEACDVFAEPGVFDRPQTIRILSAARAEGMRLRLHADEIEPMGGAELAVEMKADSADHLAQVSESGITMLAQSDTAAVLLPGTSFYLARQKHAPARKLLDAGCAVVLATDFNPGSCYTQSIPLVITLANVLLRMTPEECLHAVTINAATSLQLDDQIGTLHAGKRADLAVLDIPSFHGLGYVFGGNPVAMTIKDGRTVAINTCELDVEP